MVPAMSSRSVESPEARKLVGARIAQARKALGWSQEKLAEALGLDTITVSRIETGRRQLTAVLVMQLADVLGISLGRVLGKQAAPPDLVEEVTSLLGQMTPERQATALEVLRVLARESVGDRAGAEAG